MSVYENLAGPVIGFLQGKILLGTSSGIAISDGTVAGTQLVLPLAGYYEAAVGTTQAFFYNEDPQGHRHIWRVGTTPGETRELSPAAPATNWVAPHYFAVVNDHLCWKDASSLSSLFTLYCHDGTAGGTTNRITTPDGQYLGLFDDTHFQPFGQRLLFLGVVIGGNYMWTTDGTQAGTYQVGTLQSESVCSSSDTNGHAYFAQRTAWPQSEYQLWSTTGIPATNTLVASPHPFSSEMVCSDGASLRSNATLNSVSYFSIRLGIGRTDGTAEGTYKLRADDGTQPVYINDYKQPIMIGRYVVALGADTLWSFDTDGLLGAGFDY